MNTAYPLFYRQATLILPAGMFKQVEHATFGFHLNMKCTWQACSISESAPDSFKSIMTNDV